MSPLQGPMELFTGLLGVGSGFVVANIVDRFLATHSLVVSGTSVTDTPVGGQIYNSEAPLLPLWSSWQRLAAAAGIIFAPGIASRYVPTSWKPFFQLGAYGSAAYVGGKVINDAIATFGASSPLVLQAWGPEVAAQNRLSEAVKSGGVVPLLQAPAGTPATQPAGMFAGVPRNHTGGPAPRELNGARTLGDPGSCGGNCGGGCRGCGNAQVGTDPVSDAANLLSDQNVALDPCCVDPCCVGYNPLDPFNEGPGDRAPLIISQGGPPPDLALPPAAQAPVQCPPNMFEYPPGSGQCVSGGPQQPPPGCPPGYTMQADGSCAPPAQTTHTPDAAVTAPSCPPGYTMRRDGSCMPIPVTSPPPACPPGSVRQADGSCYTAPTGPR